MAIQVEANTTSEDKKVKNLTAILYLLQSNLEEFVGEVDKGYQLFTQVGEKTELVQSIEKLLDNPMGNLSDLSDKIDGHIRFIVDKTVRGFFHKKKELIELVLISTTPSNQLHYSIVLKDDNMTNRLQIFDFLNFYDSISISTKYPIYFQFVPIELVDKIRHTDALRFAA
jgi:hypothetical protein